MFPTIAILLTCHNRKLKTLQCLNNLFLQKGNEEEYNLEVFLVDDASSDGTAEAIKNQFPEVNIIEGNGNLFWNRGMHLAWKTAIAKKEFDYYVWLNDDTFLFKDALHTLLLSVKPNSIISGTTQSLISKETTYGGRINKKLITPNGNIQSCDYFNGNFVLIPNDVFKVVGIQDPVFHHALGDFDYSLRAKKMGIQLYVAPSFIGTCESHDFVPKWQSSSETFINRLKFLYTPLSGCKPTDFFVFEKRHYGLIRACFHYFTLHLRAIVPSLWNLKSN